MIILGNATATKSHDAEQDTFYPISSKLQGGNHYVCICLKLLVAVYSKLPYEDLATECKEGELVMEVDVGTFGKVLSLSKRSHIYLHH